MDVRPVVARARTRRRGDLLELAPELSRELAKHSLASPFSQDEDFVFTTKNGTPLYYRLGGDTFVIEAADQYRLVRVNSLDDFSMATPAIVGDRLLIRTQHRLYSIRNRN